MKKLVIIRHGKSSWDHPDLKDHLRPLIQRGVNDAFTVASELGQLNMVPDLLLSSPAIRALDTAIIVATNMEYPLNKIATDATIYEASVRELMQVVSTLDNEYDTVFIFGHNPGFTELVNELQDEQLYELPTCGTVGIEFPIEDWSEVNYTPGKQLFKLFPKEI